MGAIVRMRAENVNIQTEQAFASVLFLLPL
jgi:hypothetical protein